MSKFRVIEHGDCWNGSYTHQIGSIDSNIDLKKGFDDALKYWDGSLGMLNVCLNKYRLGENYLKYDFVKYDKNTFTKQDLKTGMYVEDRRGKRAIVLLGTENMGDIISGETWSTLRNFNNDLTCVKPYNHSKFDIVKVYLPNNTFEYGNMIDKYEKYELIWEREEKSEVKAEIEKIKAKVEELESEISQLKMEQLIFTTVKTRGKHL